MKKLTRHGNSWALVIEKPILDLLHIDPAETLLDITTDGASLRITPVRDVERRRKFDATVRETHRKFGRALKRLADE